MVIILESRLERYKKNKIYKRQRRIKVIISIFIFCIFIIGLNTVDKAVRGMMNIYDKQLYFFKQDEKFYWFHFLGKDYVVEKKEINDKINNTKVIMEDFVKTANNYLDKIFTTIKTR